MHQEPVSRPFSRAETDTLEEEIERLTRKTSQLINSANSEEREELREYAIGLLQGETETDQSHHTVAMEAMPRAPFNPLALAIPLVLVGVILFFLFPPVGIVLLLAAAVAGIWGIVRPLLYRRTQAERNGRAS